MKKVSPCTPFKNFLTKGQNRVVSSHIDGRRERKVRFGYRKKSGATETLISQMVE